MDIFVIREGTVVQYLMDAYFDQRLPVLPPEVDVVKLTWQAKNDIVSAIYLLKCIKSSKLIFKIWFWLEYLACFTSQKRVVSLAFPSWRDRIQMKETYEENFENISSQTMWINSLVVAYQNVPITFIHSETTLT